MMQYQHTLFGGGESFAEKRLIFLNAPPNFPSPEPDLGTRETLKGTSDEIKEKAKTKIENIKEEIGQITQDSGTKKILVKILEDQKNETPATMMEEFRKKMSIIMNQTRESVLPVIRGEINTTYALINEFAKKQDIKHVHVLSVYLSELEKLRAEYDKTSAPESDEEVAQKKEYEQNRVIFTSFITNITGRINTPNIQTGEMTQIIQEMDNHLAQLISGHNTYPPAENEVIGLIYQTEKRRFNAPAQIEQTVKHINAVRTLRDGLIEKIKKADSNIDTGKGLGTEKSEEDDAKTEWKYLFAQLLKAFLDKQNLAEESGKFGSPNVGIPEGRRPDGTKIEQPEKEEDRLKELIDLKKAQLHRLDPRMRRALATEIVRLEKKYNALKRSPKAEQDYAKALENWKENQSEENRITAKKAADKIRQYDPQYGISSAEKKYPLAVTNPELWKKSLEQRAKFAGRWAELADEEAYDTARNSRKGATVDMPDWMVRSRMAQQGYVPKAPKQPSAAPQRSFGGRNIDASNGLSDTAALQIKVKLGATTRELQAHFGRMKNIPADVRAVWKDLYELARDWRTESKKTDYADRADELMATARTMLDPKGRYGTLPTDEIRKEYEEGRKRNIEKAVERKGVKEGVKIEDLAQGIVIGNKTYKVVSLEDGGRTYKFHVPTAAILMKNFGIDIIVANTRIKRSEIENIIMLNFTRPIVCKIGSKNMIVKQEEIDNRKKGVLPSSQEPKISVEPEKNSS